MNRRSFLVSGSAFVTTAAPCRVAAAQSAKIGWLKIQSQSHTPGWLQAFRDGLKEHGRLEGRDYILVERYADGDSSRLASLAADLLAAKVDLILATSQPCIDAAQKVTRTVPIVGRMSDDPVASKAAATLGHPLGTVTGVYSLLEEMSPKRLALLLEAAPGTRRVGLLADPERGATARWLSETTLAADRLGLAVSTLPLRSRSDLDGALSAAKQHGLDGIVAFRNPTIVTFAGDIIERLNDARLPSIFDAREFAEDGALLSYGPDLKAIYRRLAYHAVRILDGAAAGSVPIEQPTGFELVLNQRAARRLCIPITSSLLALADEVIE